MAHGLGVRCPSYCNDLFNSEKYCGYMALDLDQSTVTEAKVTSKMMRIKKGSDRDWG